MPTVFPAAKRKKKEFHSQRLNYDVTHNFIILHQTSASGSTSRSL